MEACGPMDLIGSVHALGCRGVSALSGKPIPIISPSVTDQMPVFDERLGIDAVKPLLIEPANPYAANLRHLLSSEEIVIITHYHDSTAPIRSRSFTIRRASLYEYSPQRRASSARRIGAPCVACA
jgi:hypothetical protein